MSVSHTYGYGPNGMFRVELDVPRAPACALFEARDTPEYEAHCAKYEPQRKRLLAKLRDGKIEVEKNFQISGDRSAYFVSEDNKIVRRILDFNPKRILKFKDVNGHEFTRIV